MDPEQTIEKYLASVAESDLKGRKVYPQERARGRVADEIARSVNAKHPLTWDEAKSNKAEVLMTGTILADVEKFVGETLRFIEKVSADLKAKKAKKFDLAFENRCDSANNFWNDVITVGIRYIN